LSDPHHDRDYQSQGHASSNDQSEWSIEASQKSDDWFRSMVHNSTEIVSIVNPDGTLRYASPAFKRILGYDLEEVVGMNVLDFVHPEDLPHVLEETEKALGESGVARNMAEYRFRHKNGSWRHVESVGTYLLDDPAVRGVMVNSRDVTKRKEAEEALHQSEEKFRAVYDKAAIGMALVGPEGHLIEGNSALQKMLGYTGEELRTMNFADVTHPDDVTADMRLFNEAKAGKIDHYSLEKRYFRKDGRLVWGHLTGSAVRNEGGDLLYLIGMVEDITERKLWEESLQDTEKRYRTLVEQIPAITYIQEIAGTSNSVYVSPQVKDVVGYTPEECTSIPDLWIKILHPDDKERVLAEDLRTNETGEPFAMEYRQFAKDGRLVWLRDEATLVRDEKGNPLYWLGVQVDITERRRSEEALREAEELFRSTFEDAPIGVAMVSLPSSSPASDRRYLKVNRALCEMLGYSEEELLSKTSTEVTHPEDRQKSRARVEQLTTEGGSKYTIQKRYMRSDGRVVWALLNVSLVRDSEGNPNHFVSQFQDITGRKEAEEALRQSEAGLAEAQRLAHLGNWELDVATGEVSWSDEVFRINGLEPQEIIPTVEVFLDIVHPEDRELVKQSIDDALYENKPYNFEHRVVRPDGEVRTVQRQAEVVRDEEGQPLRLVGTVQDITERKALEQQFEHQAFHDFLTDLPNRQLFMDRLGHALRRTVRENSEVAVLFMDLDGFKVINDSLGHKTGDLLLMILAERLRRCLRPEDTFARFGGDEFTVLQEGIADPTQAIHAAERIISELRRPFLLEGRELFVTASIGIALGSATTKSPEDLLRDADTAMYRAKDEEPGGCRLFDSDMYERAVKRLNLENDLRRAIETRELVVRYQPIVNLQTGEVWGLEALVRWNHPDRGLLNPTEFVQMAEESGLVVPMGEWVLEEACRQAVRWQRDHSRTPSHVLSVNLSARQLKRSDLAEIVEGILKRTGLDAQCLSLDVTETVYIKVLEGNTVALDGLKKLGVRISIDDFGVGYSSLAYLKRLPADTLKIDKSFIAGLGADIEDTAIVQMVIDLAHIMGMEVVAEGVESEKHAALLKEMGCDMAQGFYFSKALPPEELPGFLVKAATLQP